MNKRDLTGFRSGKLVAVSLHGVIKHETWWNCRCDCGKTITIRGYCLTRKKCPKHCCGCTTKQQMRENSLKHGLHSTPIYRTYRAMMQRCLSAKHKSYKYYGGRGIKPCEFIKASPLNLLAIMGQPPKDKELDRSDNSKGYNCGTCQECISNGWNFNLKWSTRDEQMRNTRTTRLVRINGEILSASAWAKRFGIPSGTFHAIF